MKRGVKLLVLIALAAKLATAGSPAPAPAPPPDPAQPPKPVKFAITHVEDSHPQIVRILYLEEGTREIVLPPRPVSADDPAPAAGQDREPQVVRIVDDAGDREIVFPGTH